MLVADTGGVHTRFVDANTPAADTARHYYIVTLTAARENAYSAPVTPPVRTATGRLDFNRERVFSQTEALLLYYAHVFADAEYPDRSFAAMRRQLVAGPSAAAPYRRMPRCRSGSLPPRRRRLRLAAWI